MNSDGLRYISSKLESNDLLPMLMVCKDWHNCLIQDFSKRKIDNRPDYHKTVILHKCRARTPDLSTLLAYTRHHLNTFTRSDKVKLQNAIISNMTLGHCRSFPLWHFPFIKADLKLIMGSQTANLLLS